MTKTKTKIAVAIPAFKVTQHILELVDKIGSNVDKIYIVDDCCPDESGKFAETQIKDPRVIVIYNDVNQGVGGAVLAGFAAAKADGMDIGVKIDGDGQMDPAILHKFISPILSGAADYTKGNRFFSPRNVRDMPRGRIIGNLILSFVSKFSTGYWNIFDPTNGYLALDLRILEHLSPEKINKRYFFETDILFRLNLIRANVLDIPMVAIYEEEVSHLHFSKEAFRFMKGHIKNFTKRLWYNYFLREFNIASLELIVGIATFVFGLGFGLAHIGGEAADSAGIVMMSALPLLVGILLLLSFLNYDMQQVPRHSIAEFLD